MNKYIGELGPVGDLGLVGSSLGSLKNKTYHLIWPATLIVELVQPT